MDPDVDKHYKQKYFPVGGGVPSTTMSKHPPEELHSGYSTQEYYAPTSSNHPDTISTLTRSLTSLSILQIEPEDPQKPCYLSTIPDELLLNILLHLSLTSLSSLSHTSQVCKKLLSLSTEEKSLYKTLCLHYFSPFSSASHLLSLIPLYNNDWRKMLMRNLEYDSMDVILQLVTTYVLGSMIFLGIHRYTWLLIFDSFVSMKMGDVLLY